MATCRLNAPEIVVPPSSFTGVHGLAVDKRGRLLAGSVVGNAIWEADRNTGAAKVLVDGPRARPTTSPSGRTSSWRGRTT